jgi:5-methylcytosine-specific restriction endonuclease McrBC regulatory subunit McrC
LLTDSCHGGGCLVANVVPEIQIILNDEKPRARLSQMLGLTGEVPHNGASFARSRQFSTSLSQILHLFWKKRVKLAARRKMPRAAMAIEM